ncbi:hypothetical protein ACK0UN_28750, partial [Bacillus anthracis]
LHIRVGDEPVAFLREIGGRETTESWVAGGKIAEHTAWLEKNRPVVPASRFFVEGDATDLQLQLLVNNKNTGLVLEWIVRY